MGGANWLDARQISLHYVMTKLTKMVFDIFACYQSSLLCLLD